MESRALLSATVGATFTAQAVANGGIAAFNSAPTLAQQLCINNNATVTGKTASLSVLGKDNGGESKLVYNWSVTSSPSGGKATFNINGVNAAKNAIATFTKAGTYTISVSIVDAGKLSVTASKSVVVASTASSAALYTTTGQLVASNTPLTLSGVSQAFVARGVDQFGNTMTVAPLACPRFLYQGL